ncbi:MAG: YihY/virulence factor BrkB family protein [Bdellovibrionaceae bacterium]|nr:YihY/virulence factor BrkB family protein [Pseudobdellovibrionaceae bacterium]
MKQIFDTKFSAKLSRDDIFNMSASLSFYTALSLAPLLILMITFVSLMGPGFSAKLVGEIQNLVGGQAADVIALITKSAESKLEVRNLAGLFGVLTLLVSAGGVFGELRYSLNKIFDVPPIDFEKAAEESFFKSGTTFLKQKVFNVGMVLTFVFISIVSLVISSIMSFILDGAEQVLGQILNFGVSILVFTILFGAIYYFLPQRRIKPRVAIVSGITTAVLFSIGKTLIGLYLGQSAVGSAYGAAGSMIVLLTWVYYSSAIIFISAELSHRIYDKRTETIPPVRGTP